MNVHGCGACVFRARVRVRVRVRVRRRASSRVVARCVIVVRGCRERALCGCARESARERDARASGFGVLTDECGCIFDRYRLVRF